MTSEESDEIHARKLAERLRENRHPLCPQFRFCHLERLYPVRGYCVLAQSPGWFMVPSIEEYREHCMTLRFGECWWFRRPQGNTESAEWGTREDPGRERMQGLRTGRVAT
jgi:hypothetical protein